MDLRTFITAMLAGLFCLLGTAAFACSVPVFRYALERWPADPFEVVVFGQGEPDETAVALLEQIDEAAMAEPNYTNVRGVYYDLSAEDPKVDPGYRTFWEQAGEPTTPWVAVVFPWTRQIFEVYQPARQSDLVWGGSISELSVAELIDSPARRQIGRQLLSGVSAVWVFIESGDAEADEAAAAMLQKTLDRLETELELPEIAEEDERYISEDGPELRIDFEVLRISRDDAQEQRFLDMLLNMESGLRDAEGPVAIPITGRGRALAGLTGEFLAVGSIEEASMFLVGQCSCEVKALNPGTDMLMAVGWDNFITGQFVIDEDLPAMVGLPDAAAMAAAVPAGQSPDTAAADDAKAAAKPASIEQTTTAQASGGASGLWRNLAIVLVIGVMVIGVGAVWQRRNAG